jgi:hypothetical protein
MPNALPRGLLIYRMGGGGGGGVKEEKEEEEEEGMGIIMNSHYLNTP